MSIGNKTSSSSPEKDTTIFLGGGTDDSVQVMEMLCDTTSMAVDTDEMKLLHNATGQAGFDVNPTNDDNYLYNTKHSGYSPESSEESSSDDSTRHNRKSPILSLQSSNGVEAYNSYDTWKDSSILAPALSNEQSYRSNIFDSDYEVSNEDMERHFDFKSAASSPRPTIIYGQKQNPHMLPSIQKQADNSNGMLSHLVSDFPITSHSPTFLEQVKTHSQAKQGVSPCQFVKSRYSSEQREAFSADPSSSSASVLMIHPIPQKSRVETQIPIKITLSNFPAGVKRLHLPTHTISKPKLIQRPKHVASPDTLELYSMLVCTSAMQDQQKRERALAAAASKTRESECEGTGALPRTEPLASEDLENPLNGGEVKICGGCVTREKKRAARKKSKKPEEEADWASDEARRVIVFNTNEIRQWEELEEELDTLGIENRGRKGTSTSKEAMQIKMPMRIACYCRHHNEKLGFQVILTIKDYQGNLVSQAMSQSIVITDDHKAQPSTTANHMGVGPSESQWDNFEYSSIDPSSTRLEARLQRNAYSSNDLHNSFPQIPQQNSQQPASRPYASVDTTAFTTSVVSNSYRSNRSRQASPSNAGPMNKKRKSSTGPKIPESLVMTRSQVSPGPTSAALSSINSSTPYQIVPSANVSPFDLHFPVQPFHQHSQSQQRNPCLSGPPTPDSSSNDLFIQAQRSQSFDTSTTNQPAFSQPPSTAPSRAHSPSSLAHAHSNQNNYARTTVSSMYQGLPGQISQHNAYINKVIPAEGPVSGGIEVTCLGGGFYQGIEVMFGNALATTTTYWGETTLVCLLPPADRPGSVPVTLKHQNEQIISGARNHSMGSFKYIDNTEQELLRQTLIIVGKQVSGRIENAGDIVRRYLPSNHASSAWNSYGTSSGHRRPASYRGNSLSSDASTEDIVLKCLELIDFKESSSITQIDLAGENGQTLLHLGASLGYERLVVALLRRGAAVDKIDNNGFSAMHMASLRNQSQVIRRLRFAGGDPNLPSRLGFKPAEFATDPLVIRALHIVPLVKMPIPHLDAFMAPIVKAKERFASEKSLRPRVNSATRYDAGDEWEDASSDESTGITEVITRRSVLSMRKSKANLNTEMQTTPIDVRLNTAPVAAIFAWRDQLALQVQQFQQSVENLIPSLQMPVLPAITPIRNLPNYQTPAMVRRFSNLVPTRSMRNGNFAIAEANSKESDYKWWGLFSSSSPTTSPPAYEEIYPHRTSDLDAKTASISATTRDDKHEPNLATTIAKTASVMTERKTSIKFDLSKERVEQISSRNTSRKRLRSDRNLFLIWLPLLLLLITVALRDRLPMFRSELSAMQVH